MTMRHAQLLWRPEISALVRGQASGFAPLQFYFQLSFNVRFSQKSDFTHLTLERAFTFWPFGAIYSTLLAYTILNINYHKNHY